MSKDLTISIVTYNAGAMIYQCLESIFRNRHTFDFDVYVVDNNSMDNTVSTIENRFPRIHIIRNRRNVGYARANNQAILRSQSRYVLVINPDIVVLKNSVEKMFHFMEAHPDVGIAGCRLLYPSGELQLSCRRFPTVKTFLLRGFRLEGLFPRSRVLENYLLGAEDHRFDMEVDWCLGSCLMIRRDALEDVGLLDENYFMYYEDIDLCYRMKQKNWKVFYIASAEMIHHYRRLSASLPPNQYSIHHLKSALYFFFKFRKQRGRQTLY